MQAMPSKAKQTQQMCAFCVGAAVFNALPSLESQKQAECQIHKGLTRGKAFENGEGGNSSIAVKIHGCPMLTFPDYFLYLH